MIINEEPKIVDKYTPLNVIRIWEPRYHDQKILINPAKVGKDNKIIFTRAASLPGQYYLSGKQIKTFKKESNGTIMCHAVPIKELRPLAINQRSLHEIN